MTQCLARTRKLSLGTTTRKLHIPTHFHACSLPPPTLVVSSSMLIEAHHAPRCCQDRLCLLVDRQALACMYALSRRTSRSSRFELHAKYKNLLPGIGPFLSTIRCGGQRNLDRNKLGQHEQHFSLFRGQQLGVDGWSELWNHSQHVRGKE
jgi:hypothetical protein